MGRILAGEIEKPGSYSLRTLDFIRNLTKSDAEAFSQLGKLAYQISGGTWVVFTHDKEWLRTERQVFPYHQFLLSELGVMYPTDLSFQAFSGTEGETTLLSDSHLIVVNKADLTGKLSIPIWKFTGVGGELLGLVEKPLDETYAESVGKYFVQQKCKAVIGKVLERLPDGRISYDIVHQVASDEPDKPIDSN